VILNAKAENSEPISYYSTFDKHRKFKTKLLTELSFLVLQASPSKIFLFHILFNGQAISINERTDIR